MAITYDSIASTTVSGTGTSSVTFSSISSAYTDLLYIINSTGTTSVNFTMRVNGDSGSNYSFTQLNGNGSTASSSKTNNANVMLSGNADGHSAIVGHLLNYSNTTTYKNVINQGGAASGTYIGAYVGLWRSTAAINSITFYSDVTGGTTMANGTTFALYGIKAA